MRLSFLAAAFFALAAGLHAADHPADFEFHHENCLGTSLDLRIAAQTKSAAETAESAVLAEIDRVAKILSTYDPDSEVSRWLETRGTPETISTELLDVLALYDHWSGQSGGALNAGAGAVTQVWKTAAAAGRMPTKPDLDAAVAEATARHWNIDRDAGTATRLDNSPLTLDAAAKGYIIDRACRAALATSGISGVVVNIGGDLAVRGDITETVEIANPRDDAENANPAAVLELRNQAVATSGDYRRRWTIDGREYSHIVDPRTGQPVDEVISSTAVAPDADTADALATIFSILPPEESLQLASRLPGVECLLVKSNGEHLASAGMKGFESMAPDMVLAPVSEAEAGLWDPAYKLKVNLEIATIQGQRVRRPFVAVWIEDADDYPVRTIALWFKGARWLPDLRSWYRGDQLRALAEQTDLTKTISSATRGPGEYSVEWDGRDNAGNLVKAGNYTVIIEAAREHGTHQIMRKELDFSGTPQLVDLPGNEEISSASLDYHKVGDAPAN